MAESFRGENHNAVFSLRNNRSGELKLKNGRLAIDTGTSTYYTTLVGNYQEEAMAGDEDEVLRYAASPYSTATGSLYLSNGYIYLTNATGQVTLID